LQTLKPTSPGSDGAACILQSGVQPRIGNAFKVGSDILQLPAKCRQLLALGGGQLESDKRWAEVSDVISAWEQSVFVHGVKGDQRLRVSGGKLPDSTKATANARCSRSASPEARA